MIKKLINTKIIIIMKKKRHISPLYVPRLVRGIQKIVWYVGNGVRVVTKKLHVAKFLCYVTCILQFCFFSSLTFASAGKAHLPIGASTVFNQKIPVIIDTARFAQGGLAGAGGSAGGIPFTRQGPYLEFKWSGANF